MPDARAGHPRQTPVPDPRPSSSDSPEKPEHSEVKPRSVLAWFSRWLATLVIGVGTLLVCALLFARYEMHTSRVFSSDTYLIEEGDSLSRFLSRLQGDGVMQGTLVPRLYARFYGLSGKLHTGEYRFDNEQSLADVLEQVTTGASQIKHLLTVVEGTAFSGLLRQLEALPEIERTLDKVPPDQMMSSLFGETLHPEGQFFPDSYQYQRGDSDETLLRRAHKLMQERLAEAWANRAENLPIKTPYEALILASIIEKETGDPSERATIAGVFANRLRKGMRLQTDPTVIYGVVAQIGDAYDGNLTRKHLTTDTPYNTYTRGGLPPTPICLPGQASLEAAVNPADTKALYFVARGGGKHYFSKSLAEHNRAVRKFQLGQKHIQLPGE